MTRLDLAAVWTVLESSPSKAGIDAVEIGFQVVAGELLAGIDEVGRRYLLVPLLPGEAAQTDNRGRAVHLDRVHHAGAQYLAVSCVAPELYAVFTQFSRELVNSVEDADSPARATAEAFARWRALFSAAAERGVIGEEQVVGLIGELLTVECLLAQEASSDLHFWRGPYGDPQDFRTATYSLEVKSTLVREGRVVRISSVDQLEPPPSAALYLVHHQLDRDPKGFGISDLTQRLLSMGASSNELGARLAEINLDLNNLNQYGRWRYRLVKTRTYDVAGFAFPRIVRSSFVSGDVPTGTLKLSYSIDLTNEPPSPLDETDTEKVTLAMAQEAAHGMDP